MPSSIAEEPARTDKASSNFLGYSLGSCFELVRQLIAVRHVKYILDEQFEVLDNKNNEFQRMVIAFYGTTLMSHI
jgi:four helix bundle protein